MQGPEASAEGPSSDEVDATEPFLNQADIDAMTPEEIQDFYRAWFSDCGDPFYNGTEVSDMGAWGDYVGYDGGYGGGDDVDIEAEPGSVEIACRVGGCGGEICTDASNTDFASTCEFKPWYECYDYAHCRVQADRECGWTHTTELDQCLKDMGGPLGSQPSSGQAKTEKKTANMPEERKDMIFVEQKKKEKTFVEEKSDNAKTV